MVFQTILAATLIFLVGCTQPPAPAQARVVPASPVRIAQFYASPANPPKGEKTLVCFGVENATEVRLEPPIEKVWPSISRCFDLFPSKEILLTLTAARGSEQVSQSILVKPGPPAVKLLEVSINSLTVLRGEQVSVCYKAKNAIDVAIRPGSWIQPRTLALGCVVDHPFKTTTYHVVAKGEGGDIDTEHVTAKVK